MNITNFSEIDLRYHTTDKSFQRGKTYYRKGAIVFVSGADAITTVHDRYINKNLIQVVMDAAISHRPEWVIAKAVPLAEDIMNRGQAESYQEAVNWLTKARSAYIQSGQQSEWRKYQSQLMATHGRKRKLMSLMESAKL